MYLYSYIIHAILISNARGCGKYVSEFWVQLRKRSKIFNYINEQTKCMELLLEIETCVNKWAHIT